MSRFGAGVRSGAVVLMAPSCLGAAAVTVVPAAALGIIGYESQMQHEDGEWQTDKTGDLHNWIVNR